MCAPFLFIGHNCCYLWAELVPRFGDILVGYICDSEVETELGKLFSKGSKWNQTKQPRNGTKFQMLVEDIRDGVLVSIFVSFSFDFNA